MGVKQVYADPAERTLLEFQMTRRVAHFMLEALLAVIALVVVLVGVFAWRLSSGPISVDFLNPMMEEAFDTPGNDISVSVGETILAWDGGNREIDLLLRSWRLNDPSGRPLAVLPEAEVSMSLPALLHGRIAPSRISVARVRIRLIRDESGNFVWDRTVPEDADAPIEAEDALNEVAPDILSRLLAAHDPSDPLSYLESVEVRQGRMIIVDRQLGLSLRVPSVDLEIRKGGDGLLGSSAFVMRRDGHEAVVRASLGYDAEAKELAIVGTLKDFHPALLATLGDAMAPLNGIEVPADVFVDLRLIEGRFESVDFTVETGAGRIDLPEHLSAPLEIASSSAKGRFLGVEQKLELDEATIALGSTDAPGPLFSASGTAHWLPLSLDIMASAKVDKLSTDELEGFWPEGAAEGGRVWVTENMTDGAAQDAEVSVILSIPLEGEEGEAGGVVLHHASGGFAYSGLSAHYLRPMPPVTDIEGTARFDLSSLTFDAKSGRLGELSVSGGTIRLYDLDQEVQRIQIDIAAQGPLRAALDVVHHPRLDLLSKLGMVPDGAKGQAEVNLAIGFPLLKDVLFEDVAITAKGQVEGAVLPGAAFGQDLTDGNLALRVDQRGMEVSGSLTLGGIPLTADWAERFYSGDGPETKILAEVPRIDDAGFEALGLSTGEYMSGPLSLKVDLEQDRGGPMKVAVDAGLAEARLALPPLTWEKPAGAPGTASAVFYLENERLISIRALDAQAGTLVIQGEIDFDPESGDFKRADLPRLAFDGTDLTGVLVTLDGRAIGAEIAGGVLDARPFLVREGQPAAEEGGAAEEAAEGGTSQTEDDAPRPLAFSTPGLDRIITGDGRYVEAVSARARRGPGGWEYLKVEGRLPESLRQGKGFPAPEPTAEGGELFANFSIDYGPNSEGGYSLLAKTNDMGSLMRAADLMDTIEGGDLVLEGSLPGPFPEARLDARIESQDFRLRDAPVMGRVLTLASLTGISDTLSGEGIAFQRLVGEFAFEDDILTSDLMRAYGSALGVTAKGRVDFVGDGTEVIGTVVPAYSINKVLGSIPLLGPILTGGEGEGLLAVTYAVRGSIDDPQVSVNPLAVLAPGFLRSIFSAPGAEAPSDALPPPGKER
jgi:hypothetical protein